MTNFLTVSVGAGTSAGGNSRLPRIGYDNIGAGATVFASSTLAGYAAANLFDWKPYTLWMPASTGTHYIYVTPSSSRSADYFAVAQHSLGEIGGSITLQYTLDGITWLDATPEIIPAGSETIWRSFSSVTTQFWRVRVVGLVAIGVISFGVAYTPYYGQIEGFSPTTMARDVEIYSTQSEEGLSLGRSILRKNTKNSITFMHMTTNDVYNFWMPFVKHAEKKPFFFCWLYEDYPGDVGFVETADKIAPPKFSGPGKMMCTLDMVGLLPS